MKIRTVHRKMLQKCAEDQSRQGTEKTCKLRNGDAFTSRAQGELKVLRKVLRSSYAQDWQYCSNYNSSREPT